MSRRATADASEDLRISLLFHEHSKGLEWCVRIFCRVMQGLDAARKRSPAAGNPTDILRVPISPLSLDEVRTETFTPSLVFVKHTSRNVVVLGNSGPTLLMLHTERTRKGFKAKCHVRSHARSHTGFDVFLRMSTEVGLASDCRTESW